MATRKTRSWNSALFRMLVDVKGNLRRKRVPFHVSIGKVVRFDVVMCFKAFKVCEQ